MSSFFNLTVRISTLKLLGVDILEWIPYFYRFDNHRLFQPEQYKPAWPGAFLVRGVQVMTIAGHQGTT
jgi:hypothetical protein